MARITLRQLLDHAAEQGYGVPAFNINNMEQGLAIAEAADAVDSPVIIQASRGARSYAKDIMLSKMIEALVEMYPAIPICMHQDHGNSWARSRADRARPRTGTAPKAACRTTSC
jgi:fructose-bisphosphate aldolase class II